MPPPRGAPTGAAGAGGEARWTTPHDDRKRRSPGGPAPGSPLRRGSCGPVRLRGSRPVPVGGGTGGAWGVKRFETHGCYFVMVEEYPGGRGYTGWLHGRGRGGAPWGPGTGSRGTCSVWAPEERQTLAKRKGPGAGRRKRGAREAAWGACRRRGRTDGCGGERGRKTDGRKGCVDGSVWVVRGGGLHGGAPRPPTSHPSLFRRASGSPEAAMAGPRPRRRTMCVGHCAAVGERAPPVPVVELTPDLTAVAEARAADDVLALLCPRPRRPAGTQRAGDRIIRIGCFSVSSSFFENVLGLINQSKTALFSGTLKVIT